MVNALWSRSGVALLLLLGSIASCSKAREAPPQDSAARAPAPTPAGSVAQAQAAHGERKVIRKADLSLEVASVSDAYARAIALTEQRGGYVAGSSHSQAGEGSDVAESSTLSLRVPTHELAALVAELRALASGAVSERLGSEDVTDEVLDTEARIRNLRRLEEQLLELLKSATNVEGALKVHHELANARGEIERLEGRRVFLERQTAMASVELRLHAAPEPRLASDTIASSLSRASADSLRVGSNIMTGAIRFAGILLPVLLLVVLPLAATLRLTLRAARWWRARSLTRRPA